MSRSLLHRPASHLLRPGWWCLVTTAADESRGGTIASRGRPAHSAEAAMVWMRLDVRALLSCFDAEDRQRALRWLQHGQWEAVMRLKAGEPYVFTARAEDVAATWSVRPVLFLPLAGRRECTR